MMQTQSCEADVQRVGRRSFLKQGSLVLAAATFSELGCARTAKDPVNVLPSSSELSPEVKVDNSPLRIGLITDLHYADKPAAGTRFYQETIDKLADAAITFEKKQLNFIVELGDLIDAADSVETEQRYLKVINKEFSSIAADRHYVLGNHCVDMLTKQEFLDGVEQTRSYYSFDRGQFHFIVLDACFREDGEPYGRKNSKWDDSNIPSAEIEWLAEDLNTNHKKTIVFAHQRLDTTSQHGVKNGAEIRRVLEKTGNVLAVFQGHSHQNELTDIGNIHYCTLRAMVEGSGLESSGYSIAEIAPDGTIEIKGFREQSEYNWNRNV